MSVTVSGGYKITGIVDELKRAFKNAPTVLVGVPKSAGNYEDGVHIATIAATNEFGSANGRIPERPAIRGGVADSEVQIRRLYEKKLPDVIEGKLDISTIQSLVGEILVGNIVAKISSGVGPANAPYTIKKKGSSTPLIDTGTYRQSISYVLSEPGEEIIEGL